VALSRDGSVAAVLHQDGLALTAIDVGAGRVMRTETLPETRGLIAQKIVEKPDGALLVALASSTPDTRPGVRLVEVPHAAPRPAPPAATAPVPLIPEASTREPPIPLPAPEPARALDGASLTGTITGDRSGVKEVIFYGPNNILKPHARASISPDGTFRAALPPPGTYRVLLAGGPGVHLFTRPEFRTIVVGADGRGIAGIDFEVRGRL
jgi:hypothetical protein